MSQKYNKLFGKHGTLFAEEIKEIDSKIEHLRNMIGNDAIGAIARISNGRTLRPSFSNNTIFIDGFKGSGISFVSEWTTDEPVKISINGESSVDFSNDGLIKGRVYYVDLESGGKNIVFKNNSPNSITLDNERYKTSLIDNRITTIATIDGMGEMDIRIIDELNQLLSDVFIEYNKLIEQSKIEPTVYENMEEIIAISNRSNLELSVEFDKIDNYIQNVIIKDEEFFEQLTNRQTAIVSRIENTKSILSNNDHLVAELDNKLEETKEAYRIAVENQTSITNETILKIDKMLNFVYSIIKTIEGENIELGIVSTKIRNIDNVEMSELRGIIQLIIQKKIEIDNTTKLYSNRLVEISNAISDVNNFTTQTLEKYISISDTYDGIENKRSLAYSEYDNVPDESELEAVTISESDIDIIEDLYDDTVPELRDDIGLLKIKLNSDDYKAIFENETFKDSMAEEMTMLEGMMVGMDVDLSEVVETFSTYDKDNIDTALSLELSDSKWGVENISESDYKIMAQELALRRGRENTLSIKSTELISIIEKFKTDYEDLTLSNKARFNDLDLGFNDKNTNYSKTVTFENIRTENDLLFKTAETNCYLVNGGIAVQPNIGDSTYVMGTELSISTGSYKKFAYNSNGFYDDDETLPSNGRFFNISGLTFVAYVNSGECKLIPIQFGTMADDYSKISPLSTDSQYEPFTVNSATIRYAGYYRGVVIIISGDEMFVSKVGENNKYVFEKYEKYNYSSNTFNVAIMENGNILEVRESGFYVNDIKVSLSRYGKFIPFGISRVGEMLILDVESFYISTIGQDGVVRVGDTRIVEPPSNIINNTVFDQVAGRVQSYPDVTIVWYDDKIVYYEPNFFQKSK